MKKAIILISIILISLSASTKTANAAKRLIPRAKTSTSSTTTKTTTNSSGKIGVSVKFRGDRRAIVVNFSSLEKASKVTYTLSYNAKTGYQGASGSVSTTGGAVSREIIFGTCSGGTCRYDTNITNAVFSVKYTLTNGKTYVKNFRLKV